VSLEPKKGPGIQRIALWVIVGLVGLGMLVSGVTGIVSGG
jgi:hypothetical protein